MKNGAELIAEERTRQVSKEGWTPEHDDEHPAGRVLAAGIAYATAAQQQLTHRRPDLDLVREMYWPWAKKWWKPKDRVRNLVKAGALIAAEIDRELRRTDAPARSIAIGRSDFDSETAHARAGYPENR